MSGQKIDLAEIEEDVEAWVFRRDDTLALVRIARAAMNYARSGHVADRLTLDAALEPITDSAKVRSDGE